MERKQFATHIKRATIDAQINAESSYQIERGSLIGMNVDAERDFRRLVREIDARDPTTLEEENVIGIEWMAAFWARAAELSREARS